MKNNKFKKVRIKNRKCFYYDDIVKLKYFDLDNILIDIKSQENILIFDISCKTLTDQKLCVLDSVKYMDLLELMMRLDI